MPVIAAQNAAAYRRRLSWMGRQCRVAQIMSNRHFSTATSGKSPWLRSPDRRSITVRHRAKADGNALQRKDNISPFQPTQGPAANC